MGRNLSQVYSKLLEVLEGINGAAGGYFNDFSGRVYTRLHTPEDGDVLLPYLCLPLQTATERVESSDDTMRAVAEFVVFGFASETGGGRANTASALATLRIVDDLDRALLLHPRLDLLVLSVQRLDVSMWEPEETHDYGEVQYRLVVVRQVDVADLGSSA